MKKKIAILLPYKDHFTNSDAGSASIWVKDFNKHSKYKNQIKILGNAPSSKDLIDSKNYINLKLGTNAFVSKNFSYVKEFIKINKILKFNIVEVHNRPSYVNQIHKSGTKIKLVLIFHNNPISLGGSKTLSERKFLVERCEKLLFVSNWVKERFFEGFNKKDHHKCEVIYPSVVPIKKFPKKKNIISFVGKLNRSKGFNLFGVAIIKILKKYKNWSAVVVGDEPREKYNFKHKNLIYKGWISHNKALQLYNETSISVIPSTWDEPFGRTAMEAASRGCATIISKKAGLVETVNNAIFLNTTSEKEIFDNLEFLIKNKKQRSSIQKNLFSNVLHKLKENSLKIDNYRDVILNKNVFTIKSNKKLKILHISNFGTRLSNRLYFISIAKKITNGFIRLGHDVINLSDRDTIKFNRKLSLRSGNDHLNKLMFETVLNYNPDLILLGHSDNIYKSTLQNIKNYNKNIKIAQWFEDNLDLSGPDPYSNQARLLQYDPLIDCNFVTTDPSILKFIKNKKNYFYLPIPVDKNIEKLNIYQNNTSIYDLFFTMSHGVNRGVLKKNKKDERDIFMNKLKQKNSNVIFDIYGHNNRQPIWSEDFYNTISKSKMGLNLSRTNSAKYYTSNRISSLIGNGLMTFIDKKTKLDDFFNNDEVIFYKDIEDLSRKLNYYRKNDAARKRIAKKGQAKYFKYFECKIVSQYIIDSVFKLKRKNKLKWMTK
jgi:glycosyltransferase involved in cell wall biosynthesis